METNQRGRAMRLFAYILVAFLVSTCTAPPSVLDQVIKLGELRVVTLDSPTTYYLRENGPAGPEFDLVYGLARKLNVDLNIKTVENPADIIPLLLSGEAHMAAAGIAINDAWQEHINFSYPYTTVDRHLIYKRGTGKPQSIEQVIGRPIEIINSGSHVQTIEKLSENYPDIRWKYNNHEEVTDLLEKVANNKIDFTIADSNEFNIHRHYQPELRIAIQLETNKPLAWAFPKHDDSLKRAANDYLINTKRYGGIKQINDRYYGYTEKFDYVGVREFQKHVEKRLPLYRQHFESAGQQYGIDWRLLAAIGYQESHWKSNAVSRTGVRGIMMLTEATADYLNIKNRRDPESSIFGGAKFFARQMTRLPEDILEPDRTWFALAAYNVGFNHLKDARQVLQWQSKDPDTWLNMTEALPLLAKRKWYSKLPYGYARGWEPVIYVNNIRSYYNILYWITKDEEKENNPLFSRIKITTTEETLTDSTILKK